MAKALADMRLVSSWRAILKKQGLREKSEVEKLHCTSSWMKRGDDISMVQSCFEGGRQKHKTSQIFPRQQPCLSTQKHVPAVVRGTTEL